VIGRSNDYTVVVCGIVIQDTTHARLLVHQARKTYFDKMDYQKATHWKEFLDEASNVWKANYFTK
jgi:hypothetical protein